MRHYDDRLNDIFSYKEDILNRKMKGYIHSRFDPIFSEDPT